MHFNFYFLEPIDEIEEARLGWIKDILELMEMFLPFLKATFFGYLFSFPSSIFKFFFYSKNKSLFNTETTDDLLLYFIDTASNFYVECP